VPAKVIVARGPGSVAVGGSECAWQQTPLRREKFDPDEPSSIVEVEDDVVIQAVNVGRRHGHRGNRAHVVAVIAYAQVSRSDFFVVSESHADMITPRDERERPGSALLANVVVAANAVESYRRCGSSS